MNLNLESNLATKWAQAAASLPSCAANKSNEQRKNAGGAFVLVTNTNALKL